MWQHFFRPVVEQELIGSSKSFSPDKLSALSKWQLKEEKTERKSGRENGEMGTGKRKNPRRLLGSFVP